MLRPLHKHTDGDLKHPRLLTCWEGPKKTETTTTEETKLGAVDLATELTIAWLGNQNNRAAAQDVPMFLRTMHATILELATQGSSSESTGEDAVASQDDVADVTARKSLASKDHMISMIDAKPYKTLRRDLATNGLTPEQYRERYNLRADYPMVAETYSEARRAMADRIGLGQKGRQAKAAPAGAKPKRAPRAAKAA